MKILLEKFYCAEEVSDMEEDIYSSIQVADIPTDEHGFNKGVFEVTLVWKSNEEEFG